MLTVQVVSSSDAAAAPRDISSSSESESAVCVDTAPRNNSSSEYESASESVHFMSCFNFADYF